MAAETNKIVYGGDLMLFIQDKPVAFSTDAKLSLKLATREVSSKDSGYWTDKKAGRLSWDGSTEALYAEGLVSADTTTIDQLYTLMIAREPVAMIFSPKTGDTPDWLVDTTKIRFSGNAIITSLDPSAPDGDSATFSLTFEGDGVLSMTSNSTPVNIPILQSAATNAAGTLVILTYDDDMASPAAHSADFAVTVDGSPNVITAAALGSNIKTIELTVTTPITTGEVVTVNLTRGHVKSATSVLAPNLTQTYVVNNAT